MHFEFDGIVLGMSQLRRQSSLRLHNRSAAVRDLRSSGGVASAGA
jgi:hypothetical protein